MRISKFLSSAGIASRRQSESLIREGKVLLNGIVVTDLGRQMNPEQDEVICCGEKVVSVAKVYLLLHKPAACISAVSDPWGRKLVTDYISEAEGKVYPVGRLDFQTTGCLLLSNDGEFVQQMIHPRYKIPKIYHVQVKGIVSQEILGLWRQGVQLTEGLAVADQVKLLKTDEYYSWVEMTVHQGWKRQIRRMCLAVECPAVKLCRTQFAFLNVQNLAVGAYRHLAFDEVEQLKKLAETGYSS